MQEGELAEMARSNKATEAQRARQRALDAASNATDAYIEGTRLADQRRLSAFQEARELLPYMVAPGQQYQAGLEPGGALGTAFGRLGLPFQPQQLPTARFAPSQLAIAPSEQQIGQGILQQIGGIRAAGQPGPGGA